jgi:large subunit ribosomal protein L13
MKTYQPKHKDIKRDWYLLDAKNAVLGRIATKITQTLMGKHKVKYSKHMDMGDCVVVINAKDVKVTGNKFEQKVYFKHSGYPGGFKKIKYSKLIKENPGRVVELAVKRMLPDNRLRDPRMRRLKVFADNKHPYGEKFKS